MGLTRWRSGRDLSLEPRRGTSSAGQGEGTGRRVSRQEVVRGGALLLRVLAFPGCLHTRVFLQGLPAACPRQAQALALALLALRKAMHGSCKQ